MNPLAFLSASSLSFKLLLGLCAAIALLGYGFMQGNAHGTAKLDAYKGQEAIATVKLIGKRAEVVTRIQTVYIPKIQTIYQQGEIITKEVPVYVTKEDDAGCTVPVGTIRVFNAAWAGTPPGPPVESDRGPSGIPLSEATAADVHNATSCLAYKTQRDGLIEFYKGLQAVK